MKCPVCKYKLVFHSSTSKENRIFRAMRCKKCNTIMNTKEEIMANSIKKYETREPRKCEAPDCLKVFMPKRPESRFCGLSCGSKKHFFGKKVCSICKVEKKIESFHAGGCGRRSMCKPCQALKRKERMDKARVSKPAEERKKPKLDKWPTNMDFSK